jgi:hypothetical protein
MQIGYPLVRRLALEPRCMVSSSRGLAVENQLTPVATFVLHILAFAVPIRARLAELGGKLLRFACILTWLSSYRL